jgi:hypothetical protein
MLRAQQYSRSHRQVAAAAAALTADSTAAMPVMPPPLSPTISWHRCHTGGMMPRPPPERMLRAAIQRADPGRMRRIVARR